MKSQLLLTEFQAMLWAMEPSRLNAAAAMLQRWAAGKAASAEVLAAVESDKAARAARRDEAGRAGGNIAILPFYGVVTQRGNMMDDLCGPGSVSTQKFSQALRDALADDTVSQILIDIDSPGGSVYGVGELAAEIMAARSKKPIIGLANSLAASAAYWVGAACSELYVTPGGEVGSIGVWQCHFDYSQALAEEGVKPTLISAGKYKVEGNPYNPLDEDAQAFMTARVGDYYAAFTQGVAKGRGVSIAQVRDGMGQGRVLGAAAAQAENMVDGIMTFDDIIKKIQKSISSAAKPAASRRAAAERELIVLSA